MRFNTNEKETTLFYKILCTLPTTCNELCFLYSNDKLFLVDKSTMIFYNLSFFIMSDNCQPGLRCFFFDLSFLKSILKSFKKRHICYMFDEKKWTWKLLIQIYTIQQTCT